MSNNCPCCGQNWPDDIPPRIDLNTNMFVAGNFATLLNPRQAEIAYLLCEAYPRAVLPDKILARVWEHDTDVGRRNVAVQISQLRKKIAGCGYTITDPMGRIMTGGRGARTSYKLTKLGNINEQIIKRRDHVAQIAVAG